MAAIHTIDQIVTEGLELGGNPGLTVRATAFLKFLLDTIYRVQDWEFLRTTADVLADAGNFAKLSVALPATYRAIKQVTVQGGDSQPLIQMPFEEIHRVQKKDIALGANASSGKPLYFATSEEAAAISLLFYPIPDTRYTYELVYYKQPDVLAYTGASKPEFSDSSALIMAVAHFAQQWDQNNMQELIRREAKNISDAYRLNHRDTGRAGVIVLPFDEVAFPKWLRESV
jgi:hypothetical protein